MALRGIGYDRGIRLRNQKRAHWGRWTLKLDLLSYLNFENSAVPERAGWARPGVGRTKLLQPHSTFAAEVSFKFWLKIRSRFLGSLQVFEVKNI